MKITKLRYGTGPASLIEHLRLENIHKASASIGTVAFTAGQRVPEDGGRSTHEQDEVSIIIDGKITLETEHEQLTLETGALVHIPAGVPHASLALEDTRVYFMLIG